MIKSIKVTNYLGDTIDLELSRPELSGFVVLSVDGLGSGKADINMTDMSTNDGLLYNSARVPSRNITISLRYFGTDNIEEIRHKSYKYFPLKRKVTLRIETDTRTAEIEGYVESNEPDIFSSEEGADISIVCPYPFFYSAEGDGTQTTIFSGIEPMFEFPFCNNSLTENLLLMGEIQHKTENVIIYEGDIETGIKITIHAIGPATNVTIYNVTTREIMRINTDRLTALTGSAIVASDDIIIDTTRGQKSATLIRNGVTTNILNCLDRDASWFELSKGDNIIAYSAETGNEFLQFKVENKIAYEGV